MNNLRQLLMAKISDDASLIDDLIEKCSHPEYDTIILKGFFPNEPMSLIGEQWEVYVPNDIKAEIEHIIDEFCDKLQAYLKTVSDNIASNPV